MNLVKYVSLFCLFIMGCSTTFHKEVLFSDLNDFVSIEKKLNEKAIITFPISHKSDAFLAQNPKLCVAKSAQKVGLFLNWNDSARTISRKQQDLEHWLKTLGYETSAVQIKNYAETPDLEPARKACDKLLTFYWPEI